MSYYSTIQGKITYPSSCKLNNIVRLLNERGWMKGRLFYADESCTETAIKDCCIGNTLIIPYGYYRNLARVFEELLKDAIDYHIISTSTDGCFEGEVLKCNEEAKYYNLHEWAKENMPEEDKDAPDAENDFDAYCQWQSDVEDAFHKAYEDENNGSKQ